MVEVPPVDRTKLQIPPIVVLCVGEHIPNFYESGYGSMNLVFSEAD